MHQANSVVFFPPWYFWLFVFTTVVVTLVAFVTLIILSVHLQSRRRIKEREIAARLIETLVTHQKMSAAEIEQVLNCYWRLGTFWPRFSRWFVPVSQRDSEMAIRDKMLQSLSR